jgi:hypothetical protein
MKCSTSFRDSTHYTSRLLIKLNFVGKRKKPRTGLFPSHSSDYGQAAPEDGTVPERVRETPVESTQMYPEVATSAEA